TQMLDNGKNREALISHSVFKPGQVAFTRQQQALGLGHAVWCARNLVGNEPFAVLLADDLVKSQVPCLAQILHHYQKVGGNIIAVEAISPEHTNRYGIIEPGIWDHNLVDVKGIIEKPSPATAPSNIAVIGRYVLQPEVFDFLDSQTVGAGGEIQLTDSLSSMVGRLPFHGLQFEGQRFDCGDKLGFQEANIAFSLDRPDISEQMRELIGKYSSEKNA
ncbi:MAG: UTP--glucose-1-phosphate uridylyltransferase, partial [Rhodospirillaceae bacterium]